jgi:hypothetical protein
LEAKAFFGMGLKKFIALGLAMMVFFVVMKTLAIKYPIAGVSDVIKAA